MDLNLGTLEFLKIPSDRAFKIQNQKWYKLDMNNTWSSLSATAFLLLITINLGLPAQFMVLGEIEHYPRLFFEELNGFALRQKEQRHSPELE